MDIERAENIIAVILYFPCKRICGYMLMVMETWMELRTLMGKRSGIAAINMGNKSNLNT